MNQYKESINQHYTREKLGETILSAFKNAGKKIENLTRDDISGCEEFHIRGRNATREMGDLAGLTGGMEVLDIGCGVGGPARTLAAEFGCRVMGLDLVQEYCNTAEMLTEKVGMNDLASFRCGNMLDMPFETERFDVVWSQHTTMNIENKLQMIHESQRVLRPSGIFAMYEITGGSNSPIHLPVPWASDSTINFLVTSGKLRDMMHNSGFKEILWNDVTANALEWGQGVITKMSTRPKDAPPPLGLNLLMGKTAGTKLKNMVQNMAEDRIRVIQGVFHKPEGIVLYASGAQNPS